MVLTKKSGNNQNKNVKKGSKGKYFKGWCNHCGKFGHKKADCWDLEKQEREASGKQEEGPERSNKC